MLWQLLKKTTLKEAAEHDLQGKSLAQENYISHYSIPSSDLHPLMKTSRMTSVPARTTPSWAPAEHSLFTLNGPRKELVLGFLNSLSIAPFPGLKYDGWIEVGQATRIHSVARTYGYFELLGFGELVSRVRRWNLNVNVGRWVAEDGRAGDEARVTCVCSTWRANKSC